MLPPPRPSALPIDLAHGAVSDVVAAALRRCSSLEILSTNLPVLIPHDFLDHAECGAVIETAKVEGRAMMGGGADPRDIKYNLSMWPSQPPHDLTSSNALLESIY